jgi:hypothetical protein
MIDQTKKRTSLAGLSQSAKLYFFVAAGLSLMLSIFLYFSGDKMGGIFVGIWVPSILAAGSMVLQGGQVGK